MNQVIIIAEIGINHNGSLDIAKQLIDMAKDCGCDAVKFQKRDCDTCVPIHKCSEVRDTPWGLMTYLEYRKRLEFGENEYDEIDKYCKQRDIEWFASVWDIPSVQFLKRYDVKYIKIPSAMLTNWKLLEAVANEQKHTFISTGMATLSEVDKAVKIFREQDCPFTLMHCVGVYPARDEMLNLKLIPKLKKRYDCEIGYSDHSPGILAPSLAVALGASVIEKHITLDRTMWGTDQSASVEKRGLELIVRDCHRVHKMLGDGEKQVLPEELEKLRYFKYW